MSSDNEVLNLLMENKIAQKDSKNCATRFNGAVVVISFQDFSSVKIVLHTKYKL